MQTGSYKALDVLPDSPLGHEGDKCLRHSKIRSNSSLNLTSGIAAANFTHGFIGQLRRLIRFTAGQQVWPGAGPMTLTASSTFGMNARATPFATGNTLRMQVGPVSLASRLSTLRNFVRNIVGLGAEKQMARSHAGRRIAVMAGEQPVWDAAIRQFVGEAVSSRGTSVAIDLAIAQNVAATEPQPAWTQARAMFGSRTIRIDIRPEAICGPRSAVRGAIAGTRTELSASLRTTLGIVREFCATLQTSTLKLHRNSSFRCHGDGVLIHARPHYYTILRMYL